MTELVGFEELRQVVLVLEKKRENRTENYIPTHCPDERTHLGVNHNFDFHRTMVQTRASTPPPGNALPHDLVAWYQM